jgi:hypothetical protein
MGSELSEVRIAWAEHAGVRVGRQGGYDLIQCEICGFRHAIPLPRSSGSRDSVSNGGFSYR